MERPVVEVPKFDISKLMERFPDAVPVQAPEKGQLLWQMDMTDTSEAPMVGTPFKAGEPVAYIQAFYGLAEAVAAVDGRIIAVTGKQGTRVVKGEIIALLVPEPVA